MSGEEMALLEGIRQNPVDDTPRLVYADWLEERGDPMAEVIRLQCPYVEDEDVRKQANKQIKKIVRVAGKHWVGDRPRCVGFYGFSRGFPHFSLRGRIAPLRKRTAKRYADMLETMSPYSFVGLDVSSVDKDFPEWLLGMPGLIKYVNSLWIHDASGLRTTAQGEALARSWLFSRLEKLGTGDVTREVSDVLYREGKRQGVLVFC